MAVRGRKTDDAIIQLGKEVFGEYAPDAPERVRRLLAATQDDRAERDARGIGEVAEVLGLTPREMDRLALPYAYGNADSANWWEERTSFVDDVGAVFTAYQ